jgi:hypothetical protein
MLTYHVGKSYEVKDPAIKKVMLVSFNLWSQTFKADVCFNDGTVIWDVEYASNGIYMGGLGPYKVDLNLLGEFTGAPISVESSSCKHCFVNIGFYTVKMACKYCGLDQNVAETNDWLSLVNLEEEII